MNCIHCQKQFKTKITLQIHVESQHEGVVHRCKICDTQIRDIRNMWEHEKSMHGNQSFKCEKCYLILNTKKKMRRHIRTVHDEKKFSCPYCDTKFGFQFGVNKHVKSTHGNLLSEEKRRQFNIITCQICNYATESNVFERHLRTHDRKHEDIDPLQVLYCNFCNKDFKTIKTFKEHIRKLHNKEMKGYQSNTMVCGICDIVPITKNIFQFHTHVKHLSHEHFLEISRRIYKYGNCDFKTEQKKHNSVTQEYPFFIH